MVTKRAMWTALSAQAGAATPARKAKAKYRNTKVVVDGQTFDSAGEQRRHAELCMLERAGAITELKLGVYFVLAARCKLDGRTKPALRYKADFTYMESGALVVEDFKSDITRVQPVYRIKKHLMMTVHGLAIRESAAR
jgi:hypothetical protein